MSGLAGMLTFDGSPPDADLVRAMLLYQKHRGPDGLFLRGEGSAVLGFCANRTVPESEWDGQPLADPDGTVLLIADARIDNRTDLKSTLAGRGIRLRGGSDAELILGAYRIWGTECPARLLGDFAFVLFDRRNALLLAATDVYGLRPLYYRHEEGSFRWASELKAILVDPALPRKLNRRAIAAALLLRPGAYEETLCAGIRRLPPASCLVIERGVSRLRRYWELPPDPGPRSSDPGRGRAARGELPSSGSDPRGWIEEYRALLTDAVRARMRSPGAIGIWLSGGLDSSSIAALACELHRGRETAGAPEAFSFVQPGCPEDESEYLDAVVRECALPCHRFTYGSHHAGEPLDRPPDLLGFASGFCLDPVLREARDRGVRVVLDGCGGDECFLGPVTRVRALLAGAASLLPADWSEAARSFRRRRRGALKLDWIDPELAFTGRREDTGPARRPAGRSGSAVRRRIQANLFEGGNPLHFLSPWAQVHADAGIETCSPFLDLRLVEFLLAVPPSLHARQGRTKWILREAMRGKLPELVRTRTGKASADSALAVELRTRQIDRLEGLARTSLLASEGIVRINALHRSLHLLRMARLGPAECLALARFYKLEGWCRDLLEMPLRNQGENDGREIREEPGTGKGHAEEVL